MSWIQHVQIDETQEQPKEPQAKKKRAPVTTMEPGPALDEADPPELHADDEDPAPLPDLNPQTEEGGATAVAGLHMDDDPDAGVADMGGDDFAYDDVGDDHHQEPVFPGAVYPVLEANHVITVDFLNICIEQDISFLYMKCLEDVLPVQK